MTKTTAKAAFVFLFLLAFISPALAGAVGKFTAIEGRVDILKPGEKRAAPAALGATVSEGDIVRTKSGSFAEITFTDDTVLKLTQSTRVGIREYLLDGGKRKNGALQLFRGKVRATVSKGLGRVIPVIYSGPSTFRIETPTAVAGVKGTDFFVFHDMGTTGVFVLEGAVDTSGLDSPQYVARVRGGEFSIVEQHRPATVPASARDFVMSRHLKDATLGERSREREGRREDRDRKELFENAREGRVKLGRADREFREESRDRKKDYDEVDLRDFDRRDRADERDFRDFDRHSDNDRFEADRFESDHHDHDYDRPISEVNTALLNVGAFRGNMAVSAPVVISADMSGFFKDDRTWWAELDGIFSSGSSNAAFNGTVSGRAPEGTFTGTISNGSWTNGSWSADINGTLSNGTFTGTLSGSHDSSSSGDLRGTGHGTWSSNAVN